jgi:FixJ family two-component response regulator
MQNQITVYLVEENAEHRHDLAFRLGAAGIETWTFTGPDSFLASIDGLTPRPILFAISAAASEGDLVARLRRRGNDWPVIALSHDSDIGLAIDLMKQGVIDFLLKPVNGGKLLAAIHSAGELLADRLAARELRSAAESRIKALTPREISICGALLSGQANKMIAHHLGISIRTVEAHRGNIMMKAGARNFAEVFMLLTRAGLQPAPLPKPAPVSIRLPPSTAAFRRESQATQAAQQAF